KHSYGYRLEENIDKSIFKKYIKQYHEWLENGVKIAEELVERDENIVLLKIDLKRFYYNINKEKLIEEINEKFEEDELFKIILKINDRYTELLKSDLPEEDKENFGEYFLPIGLYSSAILSNIYLKEFDNNILDCYPDYYGRYVDDIFIVIRERNIPISMDLNTYLKNRFSNVFNEEKLELLKLNNSFDFKNTDKMIMKVISGNLKKIKLKENKEILFKKPSPFAYLPSEKEMKNLCNEIISSENKEIKERRFDISVYLSKNLNIFFGVPKEEIEANIKNTLDFFYDENIIKYYVYFEKIFITILLTENISLFDTIFNQINEALNNYELNDSDIKEHFFYSLKFAISLNPEFIEKNKKYFKHNFFINDDG
ncbi:RNA-directed DNA polymerase, partial [Fusobacterium hominis]|uniref:RNA-directed DNA polymerase n=1 Tax=Fusobacterium hominis TaxID=2764326 RepID=UPI0022E8F254